MAIKIVKKSTPGITVETIKHSSGAAIHKATPVQVESAGEPLCEVGIVAGQTINLGNYNSARISVSLKVPCTKVELEATYEEALGWVDQKMSELIEQAKSNGVVLPSDEEDPLF
jgi:hypothetical protein